MISSPLCDCACALALLMFQSSPGEMLCAQDSSHKVFKPAFANIVCLQILDSQANTNVDCSQGGRDMHAQAY